jgi:hypothetical protein
MGGYRSNEATLRAELAELKAETRVVERELAELVLERAQHERLQARIRILSKRWYIGWGVVLTIALGAWAWHAYTREYRARVDGVLADRDQGSFEPAPVLLEPDGESRARRALSEMRRRDADAPSDAWEVLAGYACIREDIALHQRALRAGAARSGPIRALCAEMTKDP